MGRLAGVLALALTTYQADIEHWRRTREAALKADDGWLTVAGLFWLKEGANPFGSDPSGEIVLPGAAPAHAGVFEFHDGRVTVRPEAGVRITSNTRPVKSMVMASDDPGPPDQIALNDLTMFVIKRGDRYAIRLRDKHSALRRDFTGLHWYPVKESWRITAKFVPHPQPKTLAIPDIVGITEEMTSPGVAVFMVHGREFQLEPVTSENQLFFIFKDRTSGRGTYPAGRFLYADLPKNGQVILDFNKAYTPPCAFTPYATCPLPPKQNHLSIAIDAGELDYGKH